MIAKKEDKKQIYILQANIPIGRYIFQREFLPNLIGKVSVNIL
jgi:hypothetical protein